MKQDGAEFALLSSSKTKEPIVQEQGAYALMYRHGTLKAPGSGSDALGMSVSRWKNTSLSFGTKEYMYGFT